MSRRRRRVMKKLAIRQKDYEESISHLGPEQQKGYKKPGSMNRKKQTSGQATKK